MNRGFDFTAPRLYVLDGGKGRQDFRTRHDPGKETHSTTKKEEQVTNPDTARIVQFHEIKGPLHLDVLPVPQRAKGEVRIRVKAIGLNRVEPSANAPAG
jgi:hypothetical protein